MKATTMSIVEGTAVATQEREVSQLEVPSADVELSSSTSAWSVAECGWKQILPDLPDEVIAMLATPVVVTASALKAALVPPAPRSAPAEACTPTFLAPAPLRRMTHRSARARFA
jgi:hypothetical protein